MSHVAMDSNTVFHFFLSNYKMFRTAVSDVNVLTAASCQSLDLFCAILTKSGLSPQIFKNCPTSNLTEICPVGAEFITCE